MPRESTYKGFTPARAKANAKYIAQFSEIKIRMTPERHAEVKAHSEARGESLNAFINRAIAETMDRDRTGAPEEPDAD